MPSNPQTANAILFNSPALHALKRDQLLKLCKMYSIKANGKNIELIDRLKAHAETLTKNDPLSFATRTEEIIEDSKSAQNDPSPPQPHANVPRPSEQWEVVMDSIVEEDETSTLAGSYSTKGSKDSTRSRSQQVAEFGVSRASSSRGSSLKSLASSITLKSFGSSSSRKDKDTPSLEQSRPYAEIPEVSPSKQPQTDHYTVDPSTVFDPATMTMDARPIPGHSMRQGNPAPLNARLSLGQGPRTPSKLVGPSTTLRLVSNPDTAAPGAFADFGTPKLQPYPTQFQLIMDSPTHVPPTTAECENVTPSDVLPSPPPAKSTPTKIPANHKAEPFIFGSPLPQHQRTNSQFKAAAKSVLEEMNNRLQQQGVEGINEHVLEGLNEHDKAAMPTPTGEASKASVDDRGAITLKFDRIHDRQFAQMDSIASMPAARKRKSQTKDAPEMARAAKRSRISIAPPAPGIDSEVQKRREVTRRNLEKTQRWRSSAAGSRRVSMGKGPIRNAPAKPSRFGFLAAAKSIVSSVWGKSKDPRPAAPTAIPKPTSESRAEPSTRQSKDHSSKRPPASIPRHSNRSDGHTQAPVSSLGYRTGGQQKQSTSSSSHPAHSSRLLAPTASSLAKTQPRRPSVVPPVPPIPHGHQTHDGVSVINPGEHRQSTTSKPLAEQKPLQRTASGRRPRISRGRVIAKLASQRAAEKGGNPIRPTPKVRSSFGVKERRSLAGKARPSGPRPSGTPLKSRARRSEVRPQRRRPTDVLQAAS